MKNSDLGNYYSLKNAISIPAGADLNSYAVFGNYVSVGANISATLLNCPVSGGGFTLHVERITGGIDDSYCKQKILYNAQSSVEFWRTKTGSLGWGPWLSPLTNADYEAQNISNSYGLTINLFRFGNDNIKTIKIQGYINKALTAGTEYTIATNVVLKSRVNWYHNVLSGGKGSSSISYMNIDTSGNLKITPQTAIASGSAISIVEYYV